MLHGLSFLPDCRPAQRRPEDYFADVLALSRLGDEAGFSHVKMTEHYLHPYGGYCPSPLTFLSAVAAQTRRIRLMTGCVLPAFHHPVQLAAQCAMVDAISAGRLDVGFARAYLPHEFETFGIDMDTSRQRYEATIGAILRLWTQQDVNEDTPFFSYRNANSLPQPTQRPHPPVWGAAVRSRQSFAWLAEQGFGLLVTPALTPLEEVAEHVALYRETFAEAHGQTGPQAQVLASLPLYVAETDDAAFRTGDKLLAEYLDVWASGTESWSRTRSSDYPGYTGMAHAIRAMSPEQFRTIGSAAVGCPDRVADRAHEIADTLGADGILWQVDFGGVAGEVSMKSLQLFIDKVLSRVGG